MNEEVSIFDDVWAPAPRYLARLALVEELVAGLPTDVQNFLEVGPGMGDLSGYLVARYPSTQGTVIEFSPTGANLLRRRFCGNGRITVMEQDIRMLPEASAFDLIVACEVLEHIENDTDVLNLISKRLSTEGNLLLSVPAFMSKWESGDTFAGHFRRYERDEIVAKIQAAGMAVDKLWMFGFPICQLTYPLREAYYAMKLRSTRLSKDDATKQSGVNRALARKLHQLPMAKLLSPFFKLQRLVRHTNVGDGFLVLARKMAT